jgi:hypothetical protein
MDTRSCIAYKGKKFTVEWYFNSQGKSPSYDFFESTSLSQRAKLYALIIRLADSGILFDKTKFIYEGDGIFAFKPQPDRYLTFFTDEQKIIITNGFTKKTDKLPKKEKTLTLKYRDDYFNRKNGGK